MMTGVTNTSGTNNAGQIITNNSMGSPFDNILNGGDWNSVSGTGMSTMNPTPNQDPLSNLMDSVNSLDPLNSMGKSLNEQVSRTVLRLIRNGFIMFCLFCLSIDELFSEQRLPYQRSESWTRNG